MDVAFPKESWNHVDTFHDKWSVRNDTAGGFSPRKNNPTFEFEKRGDKLLIINLMQKEVRTKQFKDYFIGFRVLDSANGKQVHTTAAYRNGFNGAEIKDLQRVLENLKNSSTKENKCALLLMQKQVLKPKLRSQNHQK